MKRMIGLLLLAMVASAQAETLTINAAEYGAEWPFTVNHG